MLAIYMSTSFTSYHSCNEIFQTDLCLLESTVTVSQAKMMKKHLSFHRQSEISSLFYTILHKTFFCNLFRMSYSFILYLHIITSHSSRTMHVGTFMECICVGTYKIYIYTHVDAVVNH